MKILSPCIPKKIRSFFCSKLIDIFYHLFLNDAIFGRVTCPHFLYLFLSFVNELSQVYLTLF